MNINFDQPYKGSLQMDQKRKLYEYNPKVLGRLGYGRSYRKSRDHREENVVQHHLFCSQQTENN